MYKLFFSTLVFFSACSISFGQSQSEMNEEEYKNYKKAEIDINAVYQKILVEYGSNTEFITNLNAAQKLWVQFRDAELKARYPENGQYGSVSPMCRYIFLTQMINERIIELKVWLEGIPEGDVCTGSVRNSMAGSGEGIPTEDPNRGGNNSNIKSFGVKVLSIPAESFEDDLKENAKIAIDVVTDGNGKVISATFQPRGSTTSSPQMINIARRSAFKLKLGSGIRQKGTIIFNFRAKS